MQIILAQTRYKTGDFRFNYEQIKNEILKTGIKPSTDPCYYRSSCFTCLDNRIKYIFSGEKFR